MAGAEAEAGGANGQKAQSEGFRLGRCKWFNVAKGWGFVTPVDEPSKEVFVHQSVIQRDGFRSLGDDEEVEFRAELTDKGWEATVVRGVGGGDCQGSHRRPGAKKKLKKVRCYNCGDFGQHLASKCPHDPLPKRCHHCKSEDHLIQDCPTLPLEKRRDDQVKSTSEDSRSKKNGKYSGSSSGVKQSKKK